MLPKAGVFPHAQGEVVAQRIAAEVSGRPCGSEFCGDGYCMLEAGEDLAGLAFGNFFAEPGPDVQLRQIGKAWHVGKVHFEKWWLAPVGVRRSLIDWGLRTGKRFYLSSRPMTAWAIFAVMAALFLVLLAAERLFPLRERTRSFLPWLAVNLVLAAAAFLCV